MASAPEPAPVSAGLTATASATAAAATVRTSASAIGGEQTNESAREASRFSTYDEFGFERPPDFDSESYESFMSSYLPVLVRRGQRWDTLIGEGSNQRSKYENVRKNRKLKRFVRKGIPSSHRAKVWMIISGAEQMQQAQDDLYVQMLSTRVEPDSPVVEQITTDLDRTFPNNIFFNQDDPKSLQQPLFNVLLAFANARPEVGYCQGMNYITGLLLLVTKDEEMAFWLLMALTENLLPEYYGPNISGLITDVRVFAEFLRTKCPTVHSRVESFNLPWALVCSKWFVCLYTDVLPVETVLRVWDCLFYEGSKILFRVAITLVKMNQEKLLAAKDFTQLVDEFKKCTIGHRITDCHNFVHSMFELSSPLPSKHIHRLRLEFGEQVQKEHEERERRRNERANRQAQGSQPGTG